MTLNQPFSQAEITVIHRSAYKTHRSMHETSRWWSAPSPSGFAVAFVGFLLVAWLASPLQATTAEKPDPPRNLTVVVNEAGTVAALNWDVPESDGGSRITGYLIRRRIDLGAWVVVTPDTGDDDTNYDDEPISLNIGQAVFYRVRALNDVGRSLLSDIASDIHTEPGAEDPRVPDPPTNLNSTKNNGVINLTWDAPDDNGGSNIIGYMIRRSFTRDSGWIVVEENTGNTDTTYPDRKIPPITNDTEVYYRVRALNLVGKSLQSDIYSVTLTPPAPVAPTAPGPPTNLAATPGANRITLTWDAPSDDGGSAITGYYIERAPGDCSGTPSFTNRVADTGSAAVTHPDTGLTAGETFCYRVSAINSADRTGSASGTAFAVVEAPDSAPDFGDETIAEQQWSIGAAVTLQLPTAAGGDGALSYMLTPDLPNDVTLSGAPTCASGCTISGTPEGISAVREDATYTWRADDSDANTADSDAAELSFNITVTAVAPGAPMGLEASGGVGQILLSWTAPTENGGSAITGYRIERATGDCAGTPNFTVRVADTGSAAATHPDTVLTVGDTWCYRISAINSVDTGDASGTASAMAYNDTLPGMPTGFTATAASGGSIRLNWTPPIVGAGDAPINGYYIERSDRSVDGDDEWKVLNDGNLIDGYSRWYHSYGYYWDSEELSNGQTVRYRIRTNSAAGNSSPLKSNEVTTWTPPGALASFSATARVLSIALTWAAPADNGGSTVTGYRVERSADGSTDWSVLVYHTDKTYYTHRNLIGGQEIHYRVSAINSVGAGEASVANATVLSPPSKPSKPRNLVATPGNYQITLTWEAPESDGDSPISGYRILFVEGSCSNYSSQPTGWIRSDAATTYTHTGLRGGAEYCYRVYAVNEAGLASSRSNKAGATVNLATPPAPTSLRAEGGPRKIDVSWIAPWDAGGPPITSYKIEWRTGSCDSGGDSPAWNTVTSYTLSYTHNNLPNSETRCYRVKATNSEGDSVESNEDDATTNSTSLNAPTGLAATRGINQVVLTWTAPSNTGGSGISGYRIESHLGSCDSEGYFRALEENWTGGVTYTNTLSYRGTTECYRVKAINSVGDSAASNEVSAAPFAVPDRPTDVSGTSSSGRVELSWTAPIDDGGKAITGYRIDCAVYTSVWYGWEWRSWRTVVEDTGNMDTTHTVSVLPLGETVGYRVYAINEVGRGSASEDVASVFVLFDWRSRSRSRSMARSTALAPKKPGAPIALRATGAIGQVELNWGTPASDGGTAITGYRVQRSDTGREGSWTVRAEDTRETDTRYTDSGLASGRTFHYRVAAINSAGRGAWSDSVRGVSTLSPEEILSSRGTLRGFGGSHAGNTLSSLAGRLSKSALGMQSRRVSIGGQDMSALASFGKDDEEGRTDARQAMESVMGLLGVRLPEAGKLAQGLAAPGAASPAAGFEMGVSPADDLAHAKHVLGIDSSREGESLDEGLTVRSRTTNELISGSSFEFPVAGNGLVDEAGQAKGGWTVWGKAAFSEFGGEDSQSSNQETLSAYMGMDFQGSGNWLMGVAVGASANDPVSPDELEFDLLSVTPYMQWSPTQKLHTWGLVSVGRGDAGWAMTGSGELGTELETRMAAFGMESTLYQRGGSEISVKGDAYTVSSVMGETEAFPEIRADEHRVRLVVEGEHGLNEGGKVPAQLSLQLAARMDGSDIEESSYLEVGTGFEVSYAPLGLHFEADGRFLVAHSEEDYQESGASLTARFDPGVRGDGISLELESNWGASASRADEFWSDKRMRVRRGGLSNARHSSLDVELAYGADWLSKRLRLEPFGEFGFDDAALSGVRFGARINVSDMGVKNGHGPLLDNMQIEFFSERENMHSEDPEHRFGIEVEMDF